MKTIDMKNLFISQEYVEIIKYIRGLINTLINKYRIRKIIKK